jgi:protein-disulfide isomerase
MKRSNNPAGINPGRTRREALGLLGASAALLGAGTMSRPAFAQGSDDVQTEALVLRDPDVPSTGNPNGDINIVVWFDYNWPYCR